MHHERNRKSIIFLSCRKCAEERKENELDYTSGENHQGRKKERKEIDKGLLAVEGLVTRVTWKFPFRIRKIAGPTQPSHERIVHNEKKTLQGLEKLISHFTDNRTRHCLIRTAACCRFAVLQ